MSFTIKCDKCGSEQAFKQGDTWHGEAIDIDIRVNYGYSGGNVDSVDIYCENPKCNNDIELDRRK